MILVDVSFFYYILVRELHWTGVKSGNWIGVVVVTNICLLQWRVSDCEQTVELWNVCYSRHCKRMFLFLVTKVFCMSQFYGMYFFNDIFHVISYFVKWYYSGMNKTSLTIWKPFVSQIRYRYNIKFVPISMDYTFYWLPISLPALSVNCCRNWQ